MLVILAFSQTVKSQCSPSPSNIYSFVYDGNNYEIIKEKLGWINAAACAVSRGGKLAEINSQDEQDSIFSQVNNAGINASNIVASDGGGSYLWIGGNDFVSEGAWVWNGNNDGTSVQFWQGDYMTGVPIGGLYNNWGDEPDDAGGQDALGFAFTNWPYGVAGQWNDINQTNLLYYIIEYATAVSILENEPASFEIYPNPATTQITVEFKSSGKTNIEIKNFLGQTVKMIDQEFSDRENKITIDLSELPAGIYFATLQADNINYNRKFIKQ